MVQLKTSNMMYKYRLIWYEKVRGNLLAPDVNDEMEGSVISVDSRLPHSGCSRLKLGCARCINMIFFHF